MLINYKCWLNKNIFCKTLKIIYLRSTVPPNFKTKLNNIITYKRVFGK